MRARPVWRSAGVHGAIWRVEGGLAARDAVSPEAVEIDAASGDPPGRAMAG
jgi:hypothetical protein